MQTLFLIIVGVPLLALGLLLLFNKSLPWLTKHGDLVFLAAALLQLVGLVIAVGEDRSGARLWIYASGFPGYLAAAWSHRRRTRVG